MRKLSYDKFLKNKCINVEMNNEDDKRTATYVMCKEAENSSSSQQSISSVQSSSSSQSSIAINEQNSLGYHGSEVSFANQLLVGEWKIFQNNKIRFLYRFNADGRAFIEGNVSPIYFTLDYGVDNNNIMMEIDYDLEIFYRIEYLSDYREYIEEGNITQALTYFSGDNVFTYDTYLKYEGKCVNIFIYSNSDQELFAPARNIRLCSH